MGMGQPNRQAEGSLPRRGRGRSATKGMAQRSGGRIVRTKPGASRDRGRGSLGAGRYGGGGMRTAEE